MLDVSNFNPAEQHILRTAAAANSVCHAVLSILTAPMFRGDRRVWGHVSLEASPRIECYVDFGAMTAKTPFSDDEFPLILLAWSMQANRPEDRRAAFSCIQCPCCADIARKAIQIAAGRKLV